jgi:putative cell wall-binding protein
LNLKRSLALALSLLLVLSVMPVFGAGETLERISGANRWATAVEISQEGWDSASVVVLANGRNYPDALAAVPLAYALDAPILLTEADELVEEAEDEIERLGATKVIIVGGTGVISEDVAEALEDLDLEVERISGANRYATAAAIAAEVAPDGADTVVLAYGRGYADALAAASYAAVNGYPILLTEKNELPEATEDAIEDLGATKVIVVGGTGVIAAGTVADLPGVTRVSGANREATSVALAEHFAPDTDMYYLATGDGFADAITGAVLAAKNGTGILLVRSSLSNEVKGFLADVNELVVFGGTGAVSTTVANAAAAALKQVDTSKLEVVSVTATNFKQFVVTFNQEVTKTTAENMNNYVCSGHTIGDGSFAILNADGKSVTVNLGTPVTQQQTEIEVTVQNVYSVSGKKVEKAIVDVEFTDVARPTVVSAVINGPRNLRVTFSEPVANVSAANFVINDGIYNVSSVTPVVDKVVNEQNMNAMVSYNLTLGNTLPDGTYKLTVNGVVDYAGWSMLKQEINFTYQKDTVKPTVSFVSATPGGVVLQLSEYVNLSGFVVRHSFDNADFNGAVSAINPNTNRVTVTWGNNLQPGPITLFVRPGNTADVWGNKFADTVIQLTGNVVVDTTKPVVTGVKVVNNTTIEVAFSESVVGANNSDNFTLKDSTGTKVNLSGASYNANTYTTTLTTAAPMNGGTFELTIQNIQDNAVPAKNKMDKFVTTISVDDKIHPNYDSNYASGRTVVLVFDEAMATSGAGSVLSRSNYKIQYADGEGTWESLRANTTIVTTDGGKTVKITFPLGTSFWVDTNNVSSNIVGRTIRIERVTDVAGNVLADLVGGAAYFKAVTVGAESAPQLMNAYAISRNVVEARFNAPLSSAIAGDFKLNNEAIDIGWVSYENRTDSDGVVRGYVIITAPTNSWTTGNPPTVSLIGSPAGTRSLIGTLVTGSGSAVAIDKMAPVVTDVVVNADGKQITVKFSEALDPASFSALATAKNGFSLTGYTTFTSANIDSAHPDTVIIKGTGFSADTEVAYNAVAGVTDTAGNLLASFDGIEADGDTDELYGDLHEYTFTPRSVGSMEGHSINIKLTSDVNFVGSSVVVKIYAGDTLLQTNTLVKTEGLGNQITCPFDFSGNFDYEEDGYWDHDSVDVGDLENPTRFTVTVRLANGKVLEGEGVPTAYPNGSYSSF